MFDDKIKGVMRDWDSLKELILTPVNCPNCGQPVQFARREDLEPTDVNHPDYRSKLPAKL